MLFNIILSSGKSMAWQHNTTRFVAAANTFKRWSDNS
jgi:hypothetical protein